jgi:hypothetical protein
MTHAAILRPGFTLAEAIRKGAAQHRQCAGSFFRRHPLDDIIATCVMGAAMVGVFGAQTSYDDLRHLFAAYPELNAERFAVCPIDPACPRFLSGPYLSEATAPLYSALAHMNDTHAWTREQCADWLEARP